MSSANRRDPAAPRRVRLRPPASASADWRWRSFPVLCGVVAGLLIASFVNGRPQNAAAATLQIVAVLGLGYCLIHLFVMNVIVAGRIKRRSDAIARGETPAEDLETELVYPDDDAADR